ncbi:hypothetical protein [Acinetobacter gerneri]|uniref:Spore coat protein U domain-containing protein n=1 Tax=Acinetobacter gerneri DSM 14967 = CIP 107464 = MTCC 9824 TaxID=1120926 RepID=N8ZEG4_9GAMM|nr:hypothetical protein [Acinetobacter gerneri]ENV32134.1 hypothetical protein F960_03520 [Acinetobacter gerneri DSM 14967 = CIP 107464 = MTCC 9824]EPR83302.1 hypothetical protein L289_2298 [Acinetobacter gerneri DSM 14967 = CIP 107464 = MTCC 9824]
MKYFSILLLSILSTQSFASACTMGSFTEPVMHLPATFRGQSATSFIVSCEQNYTVQFSALNLRSPQGDSVVTDSSNNALKTRMSILGANSNMWNVPLSPISAGRNKFTVIVELLDTPNIRVPAGEYRDLLFVNLNF